MEQRARILLVSHFSSLPPLSLSFFLDVYAETKGEIADTFLWNALRSRFAPPPTSSTNRAPLSRPIPTSPLDSTSNPSLTSLVSQSSPATSSKADDRLREFLLLPVVTFLLLVGEASMGVRQLDG